jgi:two-component system chemotaxis sensor kinase CheA
MDMSQYLGVFLDEASEQISLIETNILALEQEDDPTEQLQSLFRAAHTLKGSSRAMGFQTIGMLTHEMENVLDLLRKKEMGLSSQIVEALLACHDALGGLVERVKDTGHDVDEDESDLDSLITRLSSLRPGSEEPAQSAPVKKEVSAAPAAPARDDFENPFKLAPYQEAAIGSAIDTGLSVFQVTVVLRNDCLMKSIRVLMTFSALKPFGEILAAEPGEEDLENERFEQRFDLILATENGSDEVLKALETLSEVESLAVKPFASCPLPAAPAPLAADWTEHDADPVAALLQEQIALQPNTAGEESSGSPDRPRENGTKSAPAASQTIRVDVARLDSLLNLVGELVIDRTQMSQIGAKLHSAYPRDESVAALAETIHRIARITGELQDEIMKARMLPIDGVFQRFPRMVRDLAQKTGKDVDFQMLGGETELDRSVLECIGDPIIHLLRNSLDHGIESPADRQITGKPKRGKVVLSASHQENHIVIEVSDDGHGIDPALMKAASVAKGFITQAQADRMTEKDALSLIFASGLSTASEVSDISGRGVGMDIVKSNIEKLGGQILVESTVGKGSVFTIRLPLTLAILRALLVEAGGGCYVLPLSSVLEMLRLGDKDGHIVRRSVHGQAGMVLRGKTVPLASLTGLLVGDPRATTTQMVPDDAYIVVVGFGQHQVGLAVDRLLGQQEAVIKSLGSFLGDIPGVSGATILGDGQVALIVDVPRAVDLVRANGETRAATVRDIKERTHA